MSISDEVLDMVKASKLFPVDDGLFSNNEDEHTKQKIIKNNKDEGTHPLALRVLLQALHFYESNAASCGVAPV